MKWMPSIVICCALSLMLGCSQHSEHPARHNEAIAHMETLLVKRYHNTIVSLDSFVKENPEDYAYLGSMRSLEYLRSIDPSTLGAPKITAARVHENQIVVYWVGDSLAITGIEVWVEGSAEPICLKLDDIFSIVEVDGVAYSAYEILELFKVDTEANFFYPHGVTLAGKKIKLRLVLPDGTYSEMFSDVSY